MDETLEKILTDLHLIKARLEAMEPRRGQDHEPGCDLPDGHTGNCSIPLVGLEGPGTWTIAGLIQGAVDLVGIGCAVELGGLVLRVDRVPEDGTQREPISLDPTAIIEEGRAILADADPEIWSDGVQALIEGLASGDVVIVRPVT